MRFIHVLLTLSLTAALNMAVAEERAEWPTHIEECEVYQDFHCNYLLCLCYVGTNPGDRENQLGVDPRAVRLCQRQYDSCQREHSMPDSGGDFEFPY